MSDKRFNDDEAIIIKLTGAQANTLLEIVGTFKRLDVLEQEAQMQLDLLPKERTFFECIQNSGIKLKTRAFFKELREQFGPEEIVFRSEKFREIKHRHQMGDAAQSFVKLVEMNLVEVKYHLGERKRINTIRFKI